MFVLAIVNSFFGGPLKEPGDESEFCRNLAECTAAVQRKTKKRELETDEQKVDFVASFDWNRMTAQDETVWKEIFKTLAEHGVSLSEE